MLTFFCPSNMLVLSGVYPRGSVTKLVTTCLLHPNKKNSQNKYYYVILYKQSQHPLLELSTRSTQCIIKNSAFGLFSQAWTRKCIYEDQRR